MSGKIYSLQRIFKFVTNEIIRGLLENSLNGRINCNEIGRLISVKIGQKHFEEFSGIITLKCSMREAWKSIVESFSVVEYKKGKLYLKIRRRESSSEDIMFENMSIEEYRLDILYQMLIILLDGNLEDVNQKGMNGNTLLHLVASLPTENEDAMNFQANVLSLLIDASVDCSLDNDQGMTPLHMIAGNYLLDPTNALMLSHKRGLASECNTKCRLQKLSILKPFIQKPFTKRGRYANSILHEWVIYCSSQKKMSTIEREIGRWIICNANVPTYLANDYGCTALHYAFTSELVKILCEHKSDHDTDRLNADGDTPFLHIIKHGLLQKLGNIANETNFKAILTDKMNIKFDSQPSNAKPTTINENIIDDLNLEIFEGNGFDIASCDSAKRNCLDYLLMFVNALSSHCKESPLFQELLKYIVENWILSLLKNGGAFDNPTARENALSTLIIVFFEAGSTDQPTAAMLLDCISELFVQGADPNIITCHDNSPNPVLQYCSTKAIRGNNLHLRLVKILRENGASATRILKRKRADISKIIINTKPKRRVTLEIQSVRYKDQLDSLSRDVNPQRVLNCRYDPKLIGKGTISFVYLSIDDSVKREQALKEINKNHYQKEIKAEIHALKTLEQNQNVISLYFLEETNDFYYLAIELMDGDLTALVKEKNQHLANEATMQQLAADILRGMEFLHRKGIIHRDIKPGNILYREVHV